MSDDVLIEARDGALLITLNRPRARNAINAAVLDGLVVALELLESDQELVAGVLTGVGTDFCAGMDLKSAPTVMPDRFRSFVEEGAPKPLIAAVEGFALAGGLELALACDLIVASRGAKLGIPEARVGLLAAGGALIRLPQVLPARLAMKLAITAEPMTAEEVHLHGLVAELAEPGSSVECALRLAAQIGRNAPLSVAASRRMIRSAPGRTERELWDMQRPLTKQVFRSRDAKEGPRAFAERREPVWSGE